MHFSSRHHGHAVIFLCASLISGCATNFPTIGPSRGQIERSAPDAAAAAIQVVNVDDAVARHLLAQQPHQRFSETLGAQVNSTQPLGYGDYLEVTIWEATPATLFGSGSLDPRTLQIASRSTTLPEQAVDTEGYISVPFAGRITAAGKTLPEVEAQIISRLTGKANQPEVLVRRTRNMSATVTVVGEVNTSTRIPLSPARERLLDALAAAGGVRQPVSKVTMQVTRGQSVYTMPLEAVIRDPLQNVPLQPGDVVTALFQSLSFTALGATGKNDEIPFEAGGISLAQALARSGGMIDQRSNPTGVFIFRFEAKGALDWPRQPIMSTPEGTVPVVYRVDLSDPKSFFVMQSFAIHDKDILYVSNAPVAELQKVLNVLFTIAYPILTAKQLGF
jgi:polysaccharide export outer membrane protein